MRRLLLVVMLIASPAGAAEPAPAELVRQLERGQSGERVIAAERLGDLGAGAADAIPVLTRAAKEAHRRSADSDAEVARASRHLYRAAIDALAGIGPKAAPALAELLPGEKGEFYGRVQWLLCSLGRDAAPAVPALAKLLADDDQDFRVAVAGILESVGPDAAPAAAELAELFVNPKNKDSNGLATGSLPPPPRVAAVRALVRIGPKAAPTITDKILPILAKELKAGEHVAGGTTTEVLEVLGELGTPLVPGVVASVRKGGRAFGREDGGQALLGLGDLGRRSFAGLLADEDAEVRRAMVAALKSRLWREHFPRYHRFDSPPVDIGPLAPTLVAALRDPDVESRLETADALARRGNKVPRAAVDAVADLFNDAAVRKWVEKKEGRLSLPRLTDFGEPGVRALVGFLKSDSPAIRRMAVWQIDGSPRRWAGEAIPLLRKLTDDSDTELALDATYGAAVLSLDSKDAALLASRRFVRSADPAVRAGAAHRLGWLHPLGTSHLDALIPLLDDKDDEVVQAAAWTIYHHAPKESAAARAMVERKLVQEPTLKFARKQDAPREPPSPTVPDLVKALAGRGDDRRVQSALDLGDRGGNAKEALPALKPLLADPDPDLRLAAGYAVARITGDTPGLRCLLATEMERAAKGRPASWVAVAAFARLPADYPELIPLVARWLAREPRSTVLLESLRKYGTRAKDAVPALRKVLRGPERPYHGYMAGEIAPACEALGAIGPEAREALPELRRVLDGGQVEAAAAARAAIQKIEGTK